MNKVYGYARISRSTQNIERQVTNISQAYPTAIIFKETHTGRNMDGRKELAKLLKVVENGDTIVFDEVSRMSRNADEGFNLYEELYNDGVDLVFLKEPHINTKVFRDAIYNCFPMTGTSADYIIDGINKYTMSIAKEQVKLAFKQAQSEADMLRKRTSEGIAIAKANGKQVGGVTGRKLNVKKKKPMQEKIRKYSREFDGTLTDGEVIKLTGLARNTYYKYKAEMKAVRGSD